MTFEYNGRERRVEPYSLRHPRTGNVLLYGFDLEAKTIKAFRLDRIRDLRPTTVVFVPRWDVEF